MLFTHRRTEDLDPQVPILPTRTLGRILLMIWIRARKPAESLVDGTGGVWAKNDLDPVDTPAHRPENAGYGREGLLVYQAGVGHRQAKARHAKCVRHKVSDAANTLKHAGGDAVCGHDGKLPGSLCVRFFVLIQV